jgi:hypothetical protein
MEVLVQELSFATVEISALDDLQKETMAKVIRDAKGGGIYALTGEHSETACLHLRIKLCIMHKLYTGIITYSVYSARQSKTNFC